MTRSRSRDRSAWPVALALVLAAVMVAGLVEADEAHPLARAAAREGYPVERAALVVRAIHEAGAGDHAAILLAMAIRESSLRADVESCAVTGDGGRAVGIWQSHATGKLRERLCQGGAMVQARQAAAHLTQICRGTLPERVACYAGRSVDHRIVRDRLALAEKLAAPAAADK